MSQDQGDFSSSVHDLFKDLFGGFIVLELTINPTTLICASALLLNRLVLLLLTVSASFSQVCVCFITFCFKDCQISLIYKNVILISYLLSLLRTRSE